MEMRLASLIAAALAASAGVAVAQPPAGVATNTDQATRRVFVCDRSAETSRTWLRECADRASDKSDRVSRQVFMCDRTASTRRAWMREYGEMTFITADQFAKAEAANEGWSIPRCMTRSELRRFAKSVSGTAVTHALASSSSL
jgi:hypothetical protein